MFVQVCWGAVDIQVPTLGRERVHRHHFLHADFVDLEVKKPHFGRNGENLCKSWGGYRFCVFLVINLTQPSKKFHWATPFRRTSMG